MPLLLRTVRQNRWFKAEAAPFLANNDIPADCLGDMNTTGNQVSVWELEEDRSNLERVVRAVAVGKNKIDNAGYIVFDSALVQAAGIEIQNNPGTTADTGANGWHRDLVLTGNKMVALAKAIIENGEDARQILKLRMKELVQAGIDLGELPQHVKQKL